MCRIGPIGNFLLPRCSLERTYFLSIFLGNLQIFMCAAANMDFLEKPMLVREALLRFPPFLRPHLPVLARSYRCTRNGEMVPFESL